MIRDIKKKKIILGNRMPIDDGILQYLRSIDKKEWIAGNLMLEGSLLSRSDMECLAEGELVMGASLGECVMAKRLGTLLDFIYEKSSRGVEPRISLFADFYNIMNGMKPGSPCEYRRKNMMMAEYDYMPCLPAEIPSMIQELSLLIKDRQYVRAESEEVFLAAAELHNKIIEIMPFGESDRVLARAFALYYLMFSGYTFVFPSIKETEYNNLVYNYLRTGDSQELKELFLKETLTRLDLMIQLTAY